MEVWAGSLSNIVVMQTSCKTGKAVHLAFNAVFKLTLKHFLRPYIFLDLVLSVEKLDSHAQFCR